MNKVKYDDKWLEKCIKKKIDEVGIKKNLLGYELLKRLLYRKALDEYGMTDFKIKYIIADEYDLNFPCIERNIRYAMMEAFDSMDKKEKKETFGRLMKIEDFRPTVKVFTTILYERVMEAYEKEQEKRKDELYKW